MTPLPNLILIVAGYLIGVAVQKGSMPESVGALFSMFAFVGCCTMQTFRRQIRHWYIKITGDDE